MAKELLQSLRSPRPARFLLVDDEPAVLRALTRVVKAAHPEWELFHARNGKAALELMRAHRFDAVVADLQMPIMDGLTMLRHMIQDHAETIRIVHSSHIETLGTELVRYLAHNVIQKPASPQAIIAVLEWAGSHGVVSRHQDGVACA